MACMESLRMERREPGRQSPGSLFCRLVREQGCSGSCRGFCILVPMSADMHLTCRRGVLTLTRPLSAPAVCASGSDSPFVAAIPIGAGMVRPLTRRSSAHRYRMQAVLLPVSGSLISTCSQALPSGRCVLTATRLHGHLVISSVSMGKARSCGWSALRLCLLPHCVARGRYSSGASRSLLRFCLPCVEQLVCGGPDAAKGLWLLCRAVDVSSFSSSDFRRGLLAAPLVGLRRCCGRETKAFSMSPPVSGQRVLSQRQ